MLDGCGPNSFLHRRRPTTQIKTFNAIHLVSDQVVVGALDKTVLEVSKALRITLGHVVPSIHELLRTRAGTVRAAGFN
jgi:hypothetical protein